MNMRLGKQPATIDHRDLLLDEVVGPDGLKEAPSGFGHWPKIGAAWGMLGNDTVGDCVFAGGDHETMLWNALREVPVGFTPAAALADYSAVTGYNPADPSTDQGTNVRDALGYRRSTGLVDGAGKRHKIGAYVALEAGNWHELLEALYAFDAVGIGFEFPDYAMAQFNAGKPWAYRSGGSIEGGHYVPIVGRPGLSRVKCVTWGALQDMTRSFFEHYCDEAWGLLSVESLNAAGVTPEGLNLDALKAALAAL